MKKREKEKKERVYLIVLREGKILLVEKEGVWILPGGKIKKGETHMRALQRELQEEIRCVGENIFFYCKITLHSKTPIIAHFYLGEINSNPQPSNEIAKIKWVSRNKDLKKIQVSEITRRLIKRLVVREKI